MIFVLKFCYRFVTFFFSVLAIYLRMRTPAILFQCFPALMPHERTSSSVSIVPERDLNIPSPAVEILPPKVTFSCANVETSFLFSLIHLVFLPGLF